MTDAPLITVARVRELFRLVSGRDEERDVDACVDGAIGAAFLAASYLSEDGQLDVLCVAAYLLRSLAKNHCFIDGNKRTAWVVCLEVLEVGAGVTVSEDQVVAAEFVQQVAMGALGPDDIRTWLGNRLVMADEGRTGS
jgi:death-on-curing protein